MVNDIKTGHLMPEIYELYDFLIYSNLFSFETPAPS